MTYEELVRFLESEMQMSHVYQPVLIRALVDAGGSATRRQLAQSFLLQDESQLSYYEGRIRAMPEKVLKNRGVISSNDGLISLTVSKLSLEQRAHVRQLCEMRLQEYVRRHGLGIWDYRMLEQDPVPDSVRYKVLKAARGRCELCGATKHDTQLHVDHIVPKSRGGANDVGNLQVLCAKCNLAKGNKDDVDLRGNLESERVEGCPFCDAVDSEGILAAHGVVTPARNGT